MNQFFVMMKMNFTTKQRRISVNNTNTNLQQSQTNYELNQAYLRMSMMDRIRNNGEPCKSCGK